MKKIKWYMLSIFVMCLFFMQTAMENVSAKDNETESAEINMEYIRGEDAPVIVLKDNFKFSFDMFLGDYKQQEVERDWYFGFSMAMFDEDISNPEVNPNHMLSVNRSDIGYRCYSELPDEEQWDNESTFKTRSSGLYQGERVKITISRWKNRIMFKTVGEDGTTYGNVFYKAEAELPETLYLKLFADTDIPISDIKGTISQNNFFWEVYVMSGNVMIALGILGVLGLILVGIFCKRIPEDILVDSSYRRLINDITGGLWGISVFTAIALFMPSVRTIYNSLLAGLIDGKGVLLPVQGEKFYLPILIISLVYAIIIGGNVIIRGVRGPIISAIVLIFYAVVQAVLLYILIGIAFRAIVFVPILFIIYCVVSGSGGGMGLPPIPLNSGSDSDSRVLRDSNGNQYFVSHKSSLGDVYIRDEKGNSVCVREWNRDYYKDDNGKLYRKE